MPVTSNPNPRYQSPKDLDLARRDRIAALQAILDSVAADHNRRGAARKEIEDIERFGYSFPQNAGYPVTGPIYSQADQLGR
jgi:hypothetical protein